MRFLSPKKKAWPREMAERLPSGFPLPKGCVLFRTQPKLARGKDEALATCCGSYAFFFGSSMKMKPKSGPPTVGGETSNKFHCPRNHQSQSHGDNNGCGLRRICPKVPFFSGPLQVKQLSSNLSGFLGRVLQTPEWQSSHSILSRRKGITRWSLQK